MVVTRSICCAGEVMIELAPAAGEGQYRQDFAGDTFNTAVYLARAGQHVQYFTKLGDDKFSAAITARMEQECIDTGTVQRIPGRQPGLYMISNDDQGERKFSYWRTHSPARELFDQPATLPDASVFYFSGITLAVTRSGLDNLLVTLAQLRDQGARVVFDPNFREDLWDDRSQAQAHYRAVLPLCDTIIATQGDDALLWQVDDPMDSQSLYREYGAEEIVIRGSGLAAYACRGAEHVASQAAAVVALDTTGAGDAFNAGYLAGRLQGEGLETAIARAQALAARVIQYRGAIIPLSRF